MEGHRALVIPTSHCHRPVDVKDSQPPEISVTGERDHPRVLDRPRQRRGGINLRCLDRLDEVDGGQELPESHLGVRGGCHHVNDGDL